MSAAFVYFLTGEMYYSIIVFSGIIATVLVFVIWKARLNNKTFVIGIMILCSSKYFVEFSTSGLGTILLSLLMASFAYVYYSDMRLREELLTLIFSLSLVAKINMAIMLFPAMAFMYYNYVSTGKYISEYIKRAARLNFLIFPIIVWKLFSVLYYGLLFPMPFYAKLRPGFTQEEKLGFGYEFIQTSLQSDFGLQIGVLIGIISVIRTKNTKTYFILSGCILYTLALIYIGGGFMAGRYMIPMFVLLVVTYVSNWMEANQYDISLSIGSEIEFSVTDNLSSFSTMSNLLLLLIILAIVSSPTSSGSILYNINGMSVNYGTHNETVLTEEEYDSPIRLSYQVTEERTYYAYGTSLFEYKDDKMILRFEKQNKKITHYFADSGRKIENKTELVRPLGMSSYFSGTQVQTVDKYGLASPFIASLPANKSKTRRVSHIRSDIPEGYLQTIRTGENHFSDECYWNKYQKIETLTTGEIFSIERLNLIYEINTNLTFMKNCR